MSSSFVISLIGRPNVGKSTLFNRLMKRARDAITLDRPGVTRDRHYGIITLDEFSDHKRVDAILVDTGGFYPQEVIVENAESDKGKFDSFFNIMRDHAHVAINESDLVLLVVDVREGLLPVDQSILSQIRKHKKECWVLANKFDSHGQDGDEADFYRLGINDDQLFAVSGAHNVGIPTLRERLQIFALEREQKMNDLHLQLGVVPSHQVAAKISILGAPNAGKSTLLNKLVGSPRALVSPIAGTTVDPIEGYFDLDFGKDVVHLKENSVFLKNNLSFGEQYIKFLKNVKDTVQDEDAEEFWDGVSEEDIDDSESSADLVDGIGDLKEEIEEIEEHLTNAKSGQGVGIPQFSDETELALEKEFEAKIVQEFGSDSDFELSSEVVEIENSDTQSSDELMLETNDELEKELKTEFDHDLYQQLFGNDEEAEGNDAESSTNFDKEMTEVVGDGQDLDLENQKPINTIRTLQIVDTAGIRRASKVAGPIETQAVFRSLRMIQESDVVLYMVDAHLGFTHQDRRLCDIALEKGKSVIIILNKMDLLREKLNTPRQRKEWLLDLRAYLPWLDFCEMIQISALEGKNLMAIKRSLKKTILIRNKEIPTGPLNRLVTRMVEQKNLILPKSRGTFFKVKYAAMVKSAPPTIMLFSNRSQGVPPIYRRYLQNAIRREFNLVNTPVHLLIRTAKDLKIKGLLKTVEKAE